MTDTNDSALDGAGKVGHTPGPWWDEDDGHDTSRKIRAPNTIYPLATVTSYWAGAKNLDRNARNANARLIAAAPELLEAAQYINRNATDIADDIVVISGASYRLLRAAIARATGASS